MKVLFVDDEPMILNGLRRSLHSSGWKILLAESGQQALDILAKQSVDFVVCDMQMPGMNGAELLEIVSQKYPETVRIVLSGQADNELAARASFVAHQWLAKPCDPKVIYNEISRIHKIQSLLPTPDIQRAVGKIKGLPSPPKLFLRLRKLFQEQADMQKVATLIQEDPALAAKVLQLSNSSFFHTGKPVNKVEEAIIRLGAETVSCVVAIAETYSSTMNTSDFSMEKEQQHGMCTAMLAPYFVEAADKEVAMLSGLFHDLGKYILYSMFPDKYLTYLHTQNHSQDHEQSAEIAMFGTDHAQVAGYLLHLWNFPYPVIESILLHNQPVKLIQQPFGAAAATYLACLLLNKKQPDEMLVEHFKLEQKLPKWQKRADLLSCEQ